MAPQSASATVVGGAVTLYSGNDGPSSFVILTPPLSNPDGAANTVGDDNFQSPDLYAFNEDQNIVLSADLNVDEGTSPISSGTTVASHYVFFDPATTGSVNIQGYVLFDSPVLGIATSKTNLDASDFLANTGINYADPSLRGLESGDSVTIDSGNSYRIDVNVSAGTPGDYVRVFTALSPGATPLPASLPLYLTGLGVLGLLGWHSRRKRLGASSVA